MGNRQIVSGCRAGDTVADAHLYFLTVRTLRRLRRRMAIPDAEDRTHDAYLIVLDAVRNGAILDPERIDRFISVVGMRQYFLHIEQQSRGAFPLVDGLDYPDPTVDIERDILAADARHRLLIGLSSLPAKYRDILVRFYCNEEDTSTMCSGLNALTRGQFRNVKHRAIRMLEERLAAHTTIKPETSNPS